MLADVLATLNKAVYEALSKNSSEARGASVALEATEKINTIDIVASNALISAFGDSDCFEGCDTIEKCNIIFENFEDELVEHVRAYLANVSSTGSNAVGESGDDSDSDFYRGEET